LIPQSGKRCVDKVEMVEETEYDDVMTCDHSYDRRCHTSYTTTYEAQQVCHKYHFQFQLWEYLPQKQKE
jgi:hypothetical protein